MRILASRIVLAAAAYFLPVPTTHAQDLARVEPQPAPADESQQMADQFDLTVFGNKGPKAREDARIRMEAILAKKLATVDRTYHLSESQKQKLKLAGQGDISRLLERINAGRKNATRDILVQKVADGIVISYSENSGIAALGAAVESGPFGAESLFAKTQKTVLSREQLDKEERQRQLAVRSTKRISLDSAAALHTAARFPLDVQRISWRTNADEVGVFQFNKALEIRSGDDFRLLRTVGQRHNVTGFDFSPKGDLVAIADNSTQAFLINLSTGREIILATGNDQPSVAFSPDGKLLASGGYGNRATLWSAESGKRVANLDAGPVNGGLTPVFSPDGKILAVGNRNSSARLFDVPSGRLLRALPSEMSQGLQFDPSGQRLAITHVNGSLTVWSVGSGNLLRRGRAKAEELYSVDWSPDGTIIATSGHHASVTLWRAADLKVVAEIDAAEWVICVRFNPEGTRLVYAGGSSTPGGERFIEVLAVP